MTERPDRLHREIEAAKQLRLQLAAMLRGEDGTLSDDDLRAIQGTLEGETSLDVEIRNALLAIEEDDIFVTGLKAREQELCDRRKRLEKRIEARRGLIGQAMAVAGIGKQQFDIGTVTLSPAKPRVEVDNEAEIPAQFWRRPDPVLDRTGLSKTMIERTKALRDASEIANPVEREKAIARIEQAMPAIPGCHVEEGGSVLTIRRK